MGPLGEIHGVAEIAQPLDGALAGLVRVAGEAAIHQAAPLLQQPGQLLAKVRVLALLHQPVQRQPVLALQVPDNAKEHWLGLLFSAFAFISLSSSTLILYQASASSFKKRYAAAVAAPLAGISLLFLLRFVSILFTTQHSMPAVHQGKSQLYWAYLVFVLLVNITIFSSCFND